MKILLIAPQPFYEKRGTPLAVALLAKALGELGHEIDLLTYHLGDPWPLPAVHHHRAARLPFITSIRKGLSATKLLLDVFVFIKACNMMRRSRYDCIHGVEEGAMMGVLLKRVFRIPLVYDMDSSIPEQIRDSRSPLWTCPPFPAIAARLEHWAIHHSDLVIAVCNELRKRVVHLEPDIPVAVLEDIPVVEKFSGNLDADCQRIRMELQLNDSPCIVYTGTFEQYQGIDLLLKCVPQVVESHPDTVFILVGGQIDQMDDVRRQTSLLGIEQHVRILGRRPLEEMPAFMALAHILVSPRILGSNTPMKLYTYLQSGRPVLATRLPTHTQVLNDQVAMLVNAEPQEFAAAISRLLADEPFRERLGKAGAEFVGANFTYDIFKNKLKIAYSRISSC